MPPTRPTSCMRRWSNGMNVRLVGHGAFRRFVQSRSKSGYFTGAMLDLTAPDCDASRHAQRLLHLRPHRHHRRDARPQPAHPVRQVAFNEITLPFVDTVGESRRGRSGDQRSRRATACARSSSARWSTRRSSAVVAKAKRCSSTASRSSSRRWRQELGDSVVARRRPLAQRANDSGYFQRIEAVNYALSYDDGSATRELTNADVILVGVSRCGKTPTCLYLALQFGIRAANYPLIPEDFGTMRLPRTAEAPARQALRADHPARPPAPDPQRTPPGQQLREPAPTAVSKCAKPRRSCATKPFPTSTPPAARSRSSPAPSCTKPTCAEYLLIESPRRPRATSRQQRTECGDGDVQQAERQIDRHQLPNLTQRKAAAFQSCACKARQAPVRRKEDVRKDGDHDHPDQGIRCTWGDTA